MGTSIGALGSSTTSQILLGKLSLSGVLLWVKSYEASLETIATQVINTKDENFLIMAVIDSITPQEILHLIVD